MLCHKSILCDLLLPLANIMWFTLPARFARVSFVEITNLRERPRSAYKHDYEPILCDLLRLFALLESPTSKWQAGVGSAFEILCKIKIQNYIVCLASPVRLARVSFVEMAGALVYSLFSNQLPRKLVILTKEGSHLRLILISIKTTFSY